MSSNDRAPPTLHLYTARIAYRGPDRLDITRKSAGPDGLPFAPSWAILRPALDARAAARTALELGKIQGMMSIEADAWERYVPAYTAEMRVSYGANRAAWDALLARPGVTLVCYCTDAAHCHRRLLAAMLVKCGAIYMGER